jgi:chromosome condensin MukBEF ATPase and DNA-binding subunit MukB
MLEREQFDHLVRLGLAQYGVEVDDVELSVIHAFDQVYGPHRDALVAADLSGVEPELGLDPSRAPL